MKHHYVRVQPAFQSILGEDRKRTLRCALFLICFETMIAEKDNQQYYPQSRWPGWGILNPYLAVYSYFESVAGVGDFGWPSGYSVSGCFYNSPDGRFRHLLWDKKPIYSELGLQLSCREIAKIPGTLFIAVLAYHLIHAVQK